jgi:hypothetical protein
MVSISLLSSLSQLASLTKGIPKLNMGRLKQESHSGGDYPLHDETILVDTDANRYYTC